MGKVFIGGKVMQVQTERGLIFVEKYVRTEDEAKSLGYTYAFNSHEAKAKCYSRVTGEWSRVFCLVPYEWKEEE